MSASWRRLVRRDRENLAAERQLEAAQCNKVLLGQARDGSKILQLASGPDATATGAIAYEVIDEVGSRHEPDRLLEPGNCELDVVVLLGKVIE